MKTIERLRNPIQYYEWGSHTAIPELLGQTSPADRPQAELWMGAHPKSPSFVSYQGRNRSMMELLEEFPTEILGEAIAKKYSNQLPFLFKVLAASRPLSIQAHPNRAQAKDGFERENRLGLLLDAGDRNYRDPNHKPEVICALSPFWALNGFRGTGDILNSLEELRPELLKREVANLKERPDQKGLRGFFSALMNRSALDSRLIVRDVLDAATRSSSHRHLASWMIKLQSHFPDDIGVLSPLLLNLVELNPGEAMFLPAGELHAYLEGTGIELMANSDNVLRGGLTSKHIDVNELLSVLTFQSRAVEILSPVEHTAGEKHYSTPAEEFRLASIEVKVKQPFTSARNRNVEILICTEGTASIENLSDGGELDFGKGESVLIPAAVEEYQLRGQADFFRADVPI